MVEFDELLVTTGVDALVRLVKEREKVEMEECSKELKIPIDTIEDWARVLEEEGILRVEYKLTKIYLAWVKPSEEEVAIEKESFYKGKAELKKEVAELRGKIAPQREETEALKGSFEKFYREIYAKLDAMEKKVSPTVVSGAVSEKKFEESSDKISDMLQNIKLLKESIKTVRDEVGGMEKSVKASRSLEAADKIKRIEAEMATLMSEMVDLKKRMAAETAEMAKGVSMPSGPEIKKRFDALILDFNEVKKRNAVLREDLRNLKESTEIATSVGKELKGYEKNTTGLRKELAELSKDADSLFKKSKEVNDKLKENLDTIERFSESLEIAKTIVTKFPSQKKLSDELRDLSKKEVEISEKTAALRKLIDLMGGKQLGAKRASEIAQEIDAKLSELRSESEHLTKALEADKSTYMTFQHVKDRIIPSIEKYNSEVSRLESELEKIKESAVTQQQKLKDEAKKFKETVKEGEVGRMVEFAEGIREKKKSMDEIRDALISLSENADNLNKRIMLLSKQAELLELRAGGAPAAAAEKEATVREQLRLTQAEELEFRKKREELKKLIKKLWEEQ